MPEVSNIAPNVAEYIALREAAGMGAFSEQAATIGLKQTLYGVWIRDQGTLVGMARLVGDGGCFAQVTDVAVHPDYQGKGLGIKLMAELIGWADQSLSKGCYISLIADPGAERLYKKFGFSARTGMARVTE